MDMDLSVRNYRVVADAIAKGIDLEAVMAGKEKTDKEISDLKKQLEDAKSAVHATGATSAELFAIQQSLVKDNPVVISTHVMLQRVKEEALNRLLYGEDKGYKTAYDAYKKAVDDAYINHVKATDTKQ